jgi:uncharacterized protein (TIGR03086 family)
MTAGRPSPALVGGVAVLERAIAYALGSVALVTPDALARCTPCDAWDLRELLGHLHDSMAALQEGAETGRVSFVPAPAPSAEVLSLVRDQAVRMLGAWANADGCAIVWVHGQPVTAPLMASAGAIEVTVHGWDIAAACGLDRPIPDDLAGELLDLSAVLIRESDRPGRFAPPVPVPATAPPGARLLAFLGRHPPA